MAKREQKDIAASVHQRLLNMSRQMGKPFDALLQHYGLERFLYRLAMTGHVEKLVLKGGLVMVALEGRRSRTTRDADFSSTEELTQQELAEVVSDICSTSVADDGLDFSNLSVRSEQLPGHGDTPGVRLKFACRLGRAQVHLRVDVGFGNLIVPDPVRIEFPVLLDQPAPRIRAYSKETIVAEKFHAAVKLVALTSRMNDFYDVWRLSQSHEFDVIGLQKSVRAAFESRRTAINPSTEVFSEGFAVDPGRETLWQAFVSRKGAREDSNDFAGIMASYREFLYPLALASGNGREFRKKWPPRGPWR